MYVVRYRKEQRKKYARHDSEIHDKLRIRQKYTAAYSCWHIQMCAHFASPRNVEKGEVCVTPSKRIYGSCEANIQTKSRYNANYALERGHRNNSVYSCISCLRIRSISLSSPDRPSLLMWVQASSESSSIWPSGLGFLIKLLAYSRSL